ncbi:MAG: hypothetical protein MI974_10955 [Chitinophagales bacterium]|nr:hypothetical protein [Chitinophagales bacterium]
MNILVYPLSISHPDKENYIRNRISVSVYNLNEKGEKVEKSELDRMTRNYLCYFDQISNKKIFFSINETYAPKHKIEKLESYRADLVNNISKSFPLLQDEIIEEEELGFLPYSTDLRPSYCLALKVKTNLSELLFIDNSTSIHIDTYELKALSSHLLQEKNALLNGAEIDFSKIARKLANGLAGKAPSPYDKIASKLIGLIWPDSDTAENEWRKAYKEIKQIVKKELAQNLVNEAIIQLRGYVRFNNIEYKHIRDSGKNPQECIDALRPYNKDFFTITTNVFIRDLPKEAELAIDCISSFLLGANLHIALKQEIALQYKRISETEAIPYIEMIISLAKDYIGYAKKLRNTMIDYRLSFITKIEQKCSYSPYWIFTDNFTGKEYYIHFNKDNVLQIKHILEEERNSLIQKLKTEQENDFKYNVQPVIDSWKELEKNPIPQLATFSK